MMKCRSKYIVGMLASVFLLAALAAAPAPQADNSKNAQAPDSDTAIIYATDVATGTSGADTSADAKKNRSDADQFGSAADKSVKSSDDTSKKTQTSSKDTTNKPDKNSSENSSQKVMQRLMHYRPPAPVIKPQGEQPSSQKIAAQDKINAFILGIAPGEPMPKLLPEGAFVVSRLGRMTKSPDGFHEIFHFEADSHQSKELPVIILPSQKLERMETIVKNASDPVVFIVSGQVHVYRGANYLMLTTVKVKVHRGNLGLSGY